MKTRVRLGPQTLRMRKRKTKNIWGTERGRRVSEARVWELQGKISRSCGCGEVWGRPSR
jgi:hypothetical protein